MTHISRFKDHFNGTRIETVKAGIRRDTEVIGIGPRVLTMVLTLMDNQPLLRLQKSFDGGRAVFSVNGAGTSGHSHAK